MYFKKIVELVIVPIIGGKLVEDLAIHANKPERCIPTLVDFLRKNQDKVASITLKDEEGKDILCLMESGELSIYKPETKV